MIPLIKSLPFTPRVNSEGQPVRKVWWILSWSWLLEPKEDNNHYHGIWMFHNLCFLIKLLLYVDHWASLGTESGSNCSTRCTTHRCWPLVVFTPHVSGHRWLHRQRTTDVGFQLYSCAFGCGDFRHISCQEPWWLGGDLSAFPSFRWPWTVIDYSTWRQVLVAVHHKITKVVSESQLPFL